MIAETNVRTCMLLRRIKGKSRERGRLKVRHKCRRSLSDVCVRVCVYNNLQICLRFVYWATQGINIKEKPPTSHTRLCGCVRGECMCVRAHVCERTRARNLNEAVAATEAAVKSKRLLF